MTAGQAPTPGVPRPGALASGSSEGSLQQLESRYRRVISVLGEGIVIQRADGTVVEANAAAERILGMAPGGMLGRNSREPAWGAVDASGRPFPGHQHPAIVALETGRPVRDVVMGLPKSGGSLVWILVNAEPIPGPGGEVPSSVVTSFTDITELRAAESARREAHAWLGGVIQALNEHLYVLEPLLEGVGAMNDFVVSQFGSGPREWDPAGRADQPGAAALLSVFYPDAGSTGFPQACHSVLATGRGARMVVDWPWPGAEVPHFDVTIERFIGSRGPSLAVVGQDITPAITARNELAAAEERLRHSIDAMPDLFIRFSPVHGRDGDVVDLRFAHVNRATLEVFGRTAREVVGRTLLELFPSTKALGILDCYTQPLRTGEPSGMRVPGFDENGVSGSFDVRAAAFGNEVVVSARDITAQLAAEQALADSEARFRMLAENATDIVFEVGTDEVYRWASPSVRNLLGWRPEELVGRSNRLIIHPEDYELVMAARRSSSHGLAGVEAMRVRRADGSYLWMSGVARELRDPRTNELVGRVVGLRNVDELVESRRSAHEDRARLRATMDSLLDPHVSLAGVRDASGRVVDLVYTDVNEAALRYDRLPREEVIGKSLLARLPASYAPRIVELFTGVVESGQPLVLDDQPFPRADGQGQVFMDLRATRVGDEVTCTWRDVTERHLAATALADSEERFRQLADNTFDVVLRSREGCVSWVSQSLTRELGWSPADWIGHELAEFLPADERERLAVGRAAILSAGTAVSRYNVFAKDGSIHCIETHSSAVRDSRGQPDGAVVTFRTIDDEVRVENDLHRRATLDGLTGVLKREAVWSKLAEMTANERHPGQGVAVIYVDLDGFKAINDTYGHGAGDELLQSVAGRIAPVIRATDAIGRIGGDEFLIILDGVHDLAEAVTVAQMVQDTAGGPPVALSCGDEVMLTLSMGVTLARPGEPPEETIDRADRAMYEAKRAGTNRVAGSD